MNNTRTSLLFALALLALLLSGCGQAYRDQAASMVQQGEYATAEPLLRKAIHAYNLDPNSYLLLGKVYQETGREEQARLVFLQIARNKPKALVAPGVEPGFENKPVAELAEFYLSGQRSTGEPMPESPSNNGSGGNIDSIERQILDQHGLPPLTGQAPEEASGMGASADSARDQRADLLAGETGTEGIQHLAGREPRAGAYGVHVLSFRRALNLESGKRNMLSKFPDLLGDKVFRSRRVEMPGKGVYLRLHVGPWESKDQAAAVCGRLKKAWGYCEVVKF